MTTHSTQAMDQCAWPICIWHQYKYSMVSVSQDLGFSLFSLKN